MKEDEMIERHTSLTRHPEAIQYMKAKDSTGESHSTFQDKTSTGDVDNLSIDNEFIVTGQENRNIRTRMKKQERRLAKLKLRKQLKANKIIPHLSKMVTSTAEFIENQLL